MKKILSRVLFVLVAMAIGYGIGYAIGHLITPDESISNESFGIGQIVLTIGLAFVEFIVAFFVNTILHEAGHLVGGLMTGYQFLSLRVGSLTLQKDNDGWHWKRYSINGTLGQCLMAPPHTEELPYFWYNAGGVLVNLLIALVSALLLLFCSLGVFASIVCIMLLVNALFMFITNGIPLKVGGVPNDGMNLLTLWKHPEQRKHFHDMMAVVAAQSGGQRLKEMPQEWFESKPMTAQSSVMEISARSFYYSRLIDEFRFDEAREITEEMMSHEGTLPGMFQLEVASDRLLLELLTLNRMEVVAELWDKKVARMAVSKYIQAYKKYMPLKCAVLFAYEFINNQNPSAAEAYYNEVKSKQDSYTQPGEALTALAIMEKIRR